MKYSFLVKSMKSLVTYCPRIRARRLILCATVGLFASATVGEAQSVPAPENIAREIATGVAEFRKAGPTGTSGPVFVFEESHQSARGRVQTAVMIHRLHEKYGLRVIGLEGAIATGSPMDGTRFLPAAASDRAGREDTLLALLRGNEINAGEFAACAYPDVGVWGIEKEEEYKVGEPKGGSYVTTYLLAIGQQKLPEEKKPQFFKLFGSKNVEDMKKAYELLEENDPWLKALGQRKSDDGTISIETSIARLEEIVAEAKKRGVFVSPTAEKHMQDYLHYLTVAVKRSETMTRAVAGLAAKAGGKPVALIIGAGHSVTVLEWFAKLNVTAVLLRPNAFDLHYDPVATDFYERKSHGDLGNNDPGSIERVLNGNHLPPPLIIQPHRDAYASSRYAVMMMSRTFREQGNIPGSLVAELNRLPGIEIDQKSIHRVGNDVIFQIGVDDRDGQRQLMWVRAGRRPMPASRNANRNASLEEKLLSVESSFGGGKEPPPPEDKPSRIPSEEPDPNEKKPSGEETKKKPKEKENADKETVKSEETVLTLDRLSDEDVAAFSKERDAVEKSEAITL